MDGKKGVLKEIFYFLSLTIFLAFFLTCLFFPFSDVIANRYLKFGFYQTILFDFFRLYFPLLQISALLVFSGYFTHRTLAAISDNNVKRNNSARIILIVINIAVTGAGIILAVFISRNRYIPGGYSLPFLLSAGLVLVMLTLLFFKLKKEGVRKVIAISSLIIIIPVVILFNSFNNKINQEKPNVLFIVVDTLRSDHTSIEDPEKRTTGYLRNTLLPDSVYFRKGSSNSPWTLPSISSMITSKYPSQLGITNLVSKIDESEFTIAELMKEEGYRTGAVISHILLQESYGFSQGFDYFSDRNISADFGNHISISSPGVTEDALKFIQSQKDRRFFLFLHYFDPHYIYIDHEKKGGYQGTFRSKDISFLREQIRSNNYSQRDTEYLKYCYDTEIRFTDFYIGKVIEELKKRGIYKNTIIIFTSDHGEEFVERGWLGHSTTLYREQTGVPLMIKPVDLTHLNLKNFKDVSVSNIDIVPTLISMAGLKRMPGLTGADLLASDPDDHTFFGEVSQKEFGSVIQLVSVTWRNWKMIKNLNTNSYELYDTDRDRDEKNDLAVINFDISSKLKLKIQKWLKIMRKSGITTKKRGSLSDSEKEKLRTLGYIN